MSTKVPKFQVEISGPTAYIYEESYDLEARPYWAKVDVVDKEKSWDLFRFIKHVAKELKIEHSRNG
jgi:hypothetical protein